MCLDFPISSLSMITPVIYYVLAHRYILLERLEHLAEEKMVWKHTHTQRGREREIPSESEGKNHYLYKYIVLKPA